LIEHPSPSTPVSAVATASNPSVRGSCTRASLLSSTLKYVFRTDVHTFAFSVAANAILSFFPFVLLLLTLIRRVFRSPAMYEVVVQLLRDYLPAGQDFVIRNLNALVNARHRAQVFSLLVLLITSTGIFMPLEVALNRIWRFPENRSYLGNQFIALGLTFGCGVLALISVALTAGNVVLLKTLTFGHDFLTIRLLGFLVMKVFAIAASIAIFFLIYWLLPNGKVPARAVLPAAVIMGLLSEILKYCYIVALPRLFPGSLWPIRLVSKPDVLGISVGNVAAHRSTFIGPTADPAKSLIARDVASDIYIDSFPAAISSGETQ
jgi:membrane protein